MAVSPRKFCNLVFKWALDRIKPEEREEWIRSLNDPLPGEPINRRPSQSDLQDDAAAFLAAQKKLTG